VTSDASDPEAELPWQLAVEEARRSGVAAVAQRGGTAELSWRDG